MASRPASSKSRAAAGKKPAGSAGRKSAAKAGSAAAKAPVKTAPKSASSKVRKPAAPASKPAAKSAVAKKAAPAKTAASKPGVAAKPAPKPAPKKKPSQVAAKVSAPVPKESSRPARASKPAESKASARSRSKAAVKVAVVPPRKPAPPRAAKVHRSAPRPELLEGALPEGYGVDRLVAIPKDPEWTHLYWETSPESRERMSREGGDVRLRGFDTTGILFDGRNAPVALDIEVAPYSRSWYAKLPYQGRVYTFEFGWVDRDGEWTGISRSQPVGFEPGMSGVRPDSEEWISIASEELFRAAAGLGDGEGIQDLIRRLRERAVGSSGAAWLTSWGSGMGRLETAPSSFAPSSFSLATAPSSWSATSIGSGVSWSGLSSGEFQPPKNRPKDFWLWVETELILYGATEPDAQVTLMGRPLQLNPDGTFRVHFPFPHGTELKMDVRAVDRTGEQVREAKPAARRWTD